MATGLLYLGPRCFLVQFRLVTRESINHTLENGIKQVTKLVGAIRGKKALLSLYEIISLAITYACGPD